MTDLSSPPPVGSSGTSSPTLDVIPHSLPPSPLEAVRLSVTATRRRHGTTGAINVHVPAVRELLTAPDVRSASTEETLLLTLPLVRSVALGVMQTQALPFLFSSTNIEGEMLLLTAFTI